MEKEEPTGGVLATWDIRSKKYARMISSLYVFSSFSTERARFSPLLFPLLFQNGYPT